MIWYFYLSSLDTWRYRLLQIFDLRKILDLPQVLQPRHPKNAAAGWRSTPETGNRPKERIAQILGIRLENVAEESVKPLLPQGMAGGVQR